MLEGIDLSKERTVAQKDSSRRWLAGAVSVVAVVAASLGSGALTPLQLGGSPRMRRRQARRSCISHGRTATAAGIPGPQMTAFAILSCLMPRMDMCPADIAMPWRSPRIPVCDTCH